MEYGIRINSKKKIYILPENGERTYCFRDMYGNNCIYKHLIYIVTSWHIKYFSVNSLYSTFLLLLEEPCRVDVDR